MLDKSLYTRLPDRVYSQLKLEAQEHGLTVSSYTRMLLMARTKEGAQQQDNGNDTTK